MTTGGNCGLVIGRRQGNQRTRNNDMFKKVAGTLAALMVIFALGLCFGLLAYRWYAARGSGGYSGPALLVKVQTLSQFVTVKKISLALPRPRITDTYLDDRQTQILDHSTGAFRLFDKDLEQNARQQA